MDYFEINFYALVALVAVGNFALAKTVELRRMWLVAGSVVFLASWNWPSALTAALNSVFVFGIGKTFLNGSHAKIKLAAGVASQILFLILVRVLVPSNVEAGYTAKFISFTYLIGASYIVLQHISYLVDVYRQLIPVESSLSRFLLYSLYFPKVLVGPIEGYAEFQARVERPVLEIQFVRATFWIALGAFKGLVIANRALEFYSLASSGYDAASKPFLFFWMTALMTTVTIYCDFSALVDIGRGVSLFFGIELTPNFNQPYFATSPIDYWRRWHITLGSWMKKYVFFPVLLMMRRARFGASISTPMSMNAATSIAIAATMLVVAAWHGFYAEIFVWALSWAALQSLQVFLVSHFGHRFKFESLPARIFTGLLTFHASALIGLYTFHLLFFKREMPGLSAFTDAHTNQAIVEYRLLGLFVLLMIVIETYEKKNPSNQFYFVMALLLSLLVSMYMTGSSYLFYYMRL